MRVTTFCLIIFSALLSFFSCKKQIENYSTDAPGDYQPLQSGKYFIYRTDSIVFTNIQRNVEVHSHLEKQVVDTTITDNTGRTGYRVYRFLSDTSGASGWAPAGTFAIYPTSKTLEQEEDNLRYVKLVAPVALNYTWKGNHYLPTDPYQGLFSYNFDNNINVNDWDFAYTDVSKNDTLNGSVYSHVLVAEKSKDTFNITEPKPRFGVFIANPEATAYTTYSTDHYAKGVGLVYQELVMWEYQPPGTNGNSAYYTGFGVRRSLVSHN
jgi:hypothetical protein